MASTKSQKLEDQGIYIPLRFAGRLTYLIEAATAALYVTRGEAKGQTNSKAQAKGTGALDEDHKLSSAGMRSQSLFHSLSLSLTGRRGNVAQVCISEGPTVIPNHWSSKHGFFCWSSCELG